MALKDYSQFGPDTAPCSDNGYYVGAKGSEVQVIAGTGEVTNKVAKTDGIVVLGASIVRTVQGTYTLTRAAAGNYTLVKTDGADTSYVTADITNIIRTTASKGLKLTSVDVCYFNDLASSGLDLTSAALVINSVTYANGVANSVAAFGGTLSGSPAGGITLTKATTPYVISITLGTPAYNVTALAKVSLELALVAQATTHFTFNAFVLHFTHDYL